MSDDYVLGTDSEELQRLSFQHHVWVAQQYALLQRARVHTGQSVLDLGCGPGFTTFELAQIVGPRGRVVACDRSQRFLDFVASEGRRRGLTWIEPLERDIDQLELPPQSLDAVYSRWVFCWLPDAASALERVARFVRPGGAIVLQDYIRWGGMRVLPREPAFERGVEACLESWRRAGGIIDIVERIPEMAARAGLIVEHLAPIQRCGPVGSLEWRWMEEFFRTYLPKIVPELLTRAELDAALAVWDPRPGDSPGRGPQRFAYPPTMADVVLRVR